MILSVDGLKSADEILDFFSLIIAVCTKYTVKMFLTVKRNTCELSGMIIQKAGSKAYTLMSRNIGKGVVMIRAVKIVDVYILNDSLLNSLQRIRRAAADHQCAAFQIFFRNEFFLCKGIGQLGEQVDPAGI